MAVAMVAVFQVPDYDQWKPMFDADPVGRAAGGATGHRLMRSVDDGNARAVSQRIGERARQR